MWKPKPMRWLLISFPSQTFGQPRNYKSLSCKRKEEEIQNINRGFTQKVCDLNDKLKCLEKEKKAVIKKEKKAMKKKRQKAKKEETKYEESKTDEPQENNNLKEVINLYLTF